MACWRKGYPSCLHCWDGAQLYPWWYGHVTGSGGEDFGALELNVKTMPCHCWLVQLCSFTLISIVWPVYPLWTRSHVQGMLYTHEVFCPKSFFARYKKLKIFLGHRLHAGRYLFTKLHSVISHKMYIFISIAERTMKPTIIECFDNSADELGMHNHISFQQFFNYGR
jgi:hypothetical protein